MPTEILRKWKRKNEYIWHHTLFRELIDCTACNVQPESREDMCMMLKCTYTVHDVTEQKTENAEHP